MVVFQTLSPSLAPLDPFESKFQLTCLAVASEPTCDSMKVVQQRLPSFHLGALLQASTLPPMLLTPQPWQSLQPGAPFHPQGGVTPRDQVLCDLVYLFNNVLRSAPRPIWTVSRSSAFRLVLAADASCVTLNSLNLPFSCIAIQLASWYAALAAACHSKAVAAVLCSDQ